MVICQLNYFHLQSFTVLPRQLKRTFKNIVGKIISCAYETDVPGTANFEKCDL